MIIWIAKISNIVWVHMSRLVSVFVIKINSKCLFSQNEAQNYYRYIQVYRRETIHGWINTLCPTNFYMEMTMGGS